MKTRFYILYYLYANIIKEQLTNITNITNCITWK